MACIATAAQVGAQTPAPMATTPAKISESAALDRLFTAGKADADWFTPQFLNAVPLTQLDAVIADYIKGLGPFVRTLQSGGKYTLIFARGRAEVRAISLNASGQFEGLLVGPQQPQASGTLADALAAISKLAGETSYIVIANNREIAASNQTPLGVGSTFKLSVLATLRQEIDARRRSWSDAVRLQGSFKSLPSGVLQTWPDGSRLTLETLASLMISISDNTAADTLVNVLGRSAIEPHAFGNVPFMTTRNMFTLKSPEGKAYRALWERGSVAQRRALLAKLDALALPGVAAFDDSPQLALIEWHYTNRQVCQLMKSVQDLPLFAINPGLAVPGDFKHVAYKGGSDGGVLSMTHYVVAKDGTSFCFSVTENDTKKAIDEAPFSAVVSQVLAHLAKGRAGQR